MSDQRAPLPWSSPQQEAPGGQLDRGGGSGPSLGGNDGQHGEHYDPSPSSSSRRRQSRFDELAAMIPDIPHWTTSSSPSSSLQPSRRTAGELYSSGSITTQVARGAPPTPTPTTSAQGKQQQQQEQQLLGQSTFFPDGRPVLRPVSSYELLYGLDSDDEMPTQGLLRTKGDDTFERKVRPAGLQQHLATVFPPREPSPSPFRPKPPARRPSVSRKIRTTTPLVSFKAGRPREGLEETQTARNKDAEPSPKPHRSSAALEADTHDMKGANLGYSTERARRRDRSSEPYSDCSSDGSGHFFRDRSRERSRDRSRGRNRKLGCSTERGRRRDRSSERYSDCSSDGSGHFFRDRSRDQSIERSIGLTRPGAGSLDSSTRLAVEDAVGGLVATRPGSREQQRRPGSASISGPSKRLHEMKENFRWRQRNPCGGGRHGHGQNDDEHGNGHGHGGHGDTLMSCISRLRGPARVLASEAPESSSFQPTLPVQQSVKPRDIIAEERDKVADDAPLQQVTLAHSLGPNPVTYVSTSHGVELEVLAGSLGEEMHLPVTVSPRLELVECLSEGSGRAPFHEDGSKEEFLAMSFVHGPEEATFLASKPAKLRFFLGYVDEFAPGDGSNQVVDEKDVEKHVLETYRPLTSPDGVKDWTVLGQYSVLFPPPVLGDREVWVEVALNHFCTVANGVKTAVVPNIPGYNHDKPSDRPYYTGDIGGLFGMLRRKLKGGSAPPMVRFGNATQEYATFTYYPRIEQTTTGQGSEAYGEVGIGGVSVGAGRGRESLTEGCSLPTARRPITKTVRAGTYQDCEMTCGLSAHPQMNVRVGAIKNLKEDNSGTLQILDEDLISGNRILVLRPVRLQMLHQFSKLPWPSTAQVIMNHES